MMNPRRNWAFETHRLNAREALRLFDDASELLDILRPCLRLAFISNGASDAQRAALRVLGIEQAFDAIVISGEVGIAKPDRSIFALALDKLEGKPENAWHVGDRLRTDVEGALSAGLTAVWFNRSRGARNDDDPKPDYEIRSLKELIPPLLADH